MRFIEYMPLDGGLWEREKVLFAAEILDRITRRSARWSRPPTRIRALRRSITTIVDGGGRVGLIASVSRPFCMSCNRMRLTSDGKLRNCLFSLDETDIRGLLRGNATEEEVAQAVRDVRGRQVGRPRDQHRPVRPARPADALDRRVRSGLTRTGIGSDLLDGE